MNTNPCYHDFENRRETKMQRMRSVSDRSMANMDRLDRPLTLLDLPVDILNQTIREITHTNDLTALAMTHSFLHDLVVPHIYWRFDIVWPEANPTLENRVGVDALTYGLATLVMAPDVFGEADHQLPQSCSEHHGDHPPPRKRTRRGNHFAEHTRKFSLGNGPTEWVSEYTTTKESGKMLGTLVALAVGRMKNLETFIWDMPTGVVRDVWLALASLGQRHDRDCRLEKVWIRWHDNRDPLSLGSPTPQPPNIHSFVPHASIANHNLLSALPAQSSEYPTFSILPPIKSINVLDIDEVYYAEELGVLLEKSSQIVRELRIGVAEHAQKDAAFQPSGNGPIVTFIPSLETHGRTGGLLGIVFHRFLPPDTIALDQNPDLQKTVVLSMTSEPTDIEHAKIVDPSPYDEPYEDNVHGDIVSETVSTSNHQPGSLSQTLPKLLHERIDSCSSSRSLSTASIITTRSECDKKLKLDLLELERVHLSVNSLSRVVDWTKLGSLTLLGCTNHEQLWKALRKAYTPAALRHKTPVKATIAQRPRSSSIVPAINPSEYKLSLTSIHTDTVSRALLSFIRDTLLPDSFTSLFLQETPSHKCTVTIEEVYKSAIRYHRHSLRKLLIDSSHRKQTPHERERERERDRDRDREFEDNNWRKWICHRDLLNSLTTSKIQLRELSIAIDYKDWHYFLQRLPSLSTLRSLHITHIADHPYGRNLDPKEIAMSVLDIISLKPEMELCYLGVEKKCYEILESKATKTPRLRYRGADAMMTGFVHHGDENDDEDTEGSIDPLSQATNGLHIDDPQAHDNWDADSQESEDASLDEMTDDDESNDGAPGKDRIVFKPREILFYDDKISIFKARHGRL